MVQSNGQKCCILFVNLKLSLSSILLYGLHCVTLCAGHFTQLVWKDTKQMGVAKARSAAGTKVFVVANFDPQGNWMGQFADQVPPVG